MPLRLDHVVISVTDLQAAMRDFQNAGFRLQYGGKHADGITENALILFADGSYLELIALTTGQQREAAGFKQLLRENGEGYTGYALYSDDLVEDLNTMEAQGIYVSPIRPGGRARPDGVVLQWRIALLDNGMSPFVIQDDSPREWRVPAFGEDVLHENGARGIQALNIHCSNYDASLKRYSAICGTAPEETASFARFRLGDTELLLYRHPQYQEAIHEDIISLSLYKATSIPQRLSIRGIVFVLANAT
jgi:catechol 2,3-dioxygenase-like lactoylglutathione lyase family enzyme